MLSSLRMQVRLGLFHLPLHCLWWEIGEARRCYLKEDAGDGVFVDLCQAEVQLHQLHLLCQPERGYPHISTDHRGVTIDMH